MSEKRKAFQYLSGKENPQFLEDGKRIYIEMRNKYPLQTVEHLDNVLNGICASLVCMMHANVEKDNHKNFIQIVWKILNDNTG
jgi:hypothetical protein